MYKRLAASLIAVISLSSFAGCGSSSATSPDGGAGADLGLPSGTTVQTLAIGPIPLAAGEERTVCSRFRLPTTADIDVVRIAATLAPGSHHLILYKSPATTEKKDLYDCEALDLRQNDVPIYIAETETNNALPLPHGVAWHFPAGQMVRLEAHYLNATSKALTGMGNVELYVGPPATYQAADIMFCGSVSPLVKELGGTGVVPGKSTLPPGFYAPPPGIEIFGLTTHEHKRGTLMTVGKSTQAADPGALLDNGTPYDNPPFVVYDDAHLLSFGPGEGLRWQCSYDNPSSKTYWFGQSAENDEMCFLWAYYYPSTGRFISTECAD